MNLKYYYDSKVKLRKIINFRFQAISYGMKRNRQIHLVHIAIVGKKIFVFKLALYV